ncbi:Uncharacterized protein Nst1_486 [Candidatus Nanobsidianus stetteri]|uniref:Uncharacterized protein n=1 Tax=Nanobsidianus stetteri TaxID=1294122 RepID=R1E3V0_NANST|nr:Uncharacterized protein Nst1_486 [Candidatus Nanobsidianus stetteri]
MGLKDIFRKKLKEAHQLEKDYLDLANRYNLDYITGSDHFIILSNKRLSEDADRRKSDTSPWPGIKIHSPLSVKMYNILRSYDFTQMLKNEEIDGIKVYLYDDPSTKHKEVTIYISLGSMPNLGKLLNILEKNGISIQPALSSYYHQGYKMVLLNRIPIDSYTGVFVRYSTDFTGKMNIRDIENIRNSIMSNIDTKNINNYINQVKILQDYIIGKYIDKIDDRVWRSAADTSSPRIVAVPRGWLLNNQYNLDEILRNSYTSLKDFYYKLLRNSDPKELLRYSSTIYTFIKLGEIDGTIVAYPAIIISYDKNNNLLEAYDIFRAKIVKYNLSNEEDITAISRDPESELYEFLKYGTVIS